MLSATRWRWSGDRAILVDVPAAPLAEANARARRLAERIRRLAAREVEEVVPGAQSVLVALRAGKAPSAGLLAALAEPDAGDELAVESALREIPVRYGGADGPDLQRVAEHGGLSPVAIAARHAAAVFTVGFVGFAPGFAYLIGLPSELETPRLESPRPRVPAGSVAIADAFSAVYPRPTPGGWNLIGRTEASLFSLDREPPALLRPGDRVRFVAK